MTKINVFQTWQYLITKVNTQQNGEVPPTTFVNWYNEISKWLFHELVDEFQRNQVISDLLSPFMAYANVLTVQQAGKNWSICRYPADYEFLANLSIFRQEEEGTCFCNKEFPLIDGDGKSKPYEDPDFAQMKINFAGANFIETQIKVIDTMRWNGCLDHKTKGPSWQKPKATQIAAGFKVAPKNIQTVFLSYFKTPTTATFAYTIASDILVYNASGSTQLDWSEITMPIFLAKLVQAYGVYINDTNIYKMGEGMLAEAWANLNK